MLVVEAVVVTNLIVLVVLASDEIASQLRVQFSYNYIDHMQYYSIMVFL
jgi:hypothetical protein